MSDNESNIRAEKLKKFFNDKDLAQQDVAEVLGISQPLVSAYLNGKPFGKRSAKKWGDAFGLSPNWLLLGVGDMLYKEKTKPTVSNTIEKLSIDLDKHEAYPLIPLDSVAGYGDDQFGISLEDCEHYIIPDFKNKGVDFLIRVSGSSMYPKYSNGDLLACRKIDDILFFQWGKIYVIDSSQGQLVKRVFEDKDNPDNIICVSDNQDNYPEFSIPKSDIRSLSLVLGAIKLE